MFHTALAPPADARQLSLDDAPHDLAGLLPFAVRFATLAPSGHNTQPWAFAIDGDTVTVLADRSRRLPVVDPHDRELVISVGAALYGLRLAFTATGHPVDVDTTPTADPDLVARVRVRPDRHDPEPGSARMFYAALARRTNRKPFERRPVPAATVDRIVRAAREEGATLLTLERAQKNAVADLIGRGDRTQMADRAFRAELSAWIRGNHSAATDGIRGYGFGFSDLVSLGAPLVLRTFDIGRGQAAHDHELAAGSPLLAVVTTAHDAPSDWLAAGQGLYRALLTATADGVSASFLNQPIEVAELRPALADALATSGFPQLLLRFGCGHRVALQPRRPLDEVMRLTAVPG